MWRKPENPAGPQADEQPPFQYLPLTTEERRPMLAASLLLLLLGGLVTTAVVKMQADSGGTTAQRAEASPPASGSARVGLDLEPGRFPYGLQSGARVRIVHTPASSPRSGPGDVAVRRGRVLADNARVDSVDPPRHTGHARMTVIVDSALSPDLAVYASKGEIAVIDLPARKARTSG
ncbi:hypothetical protein E1286_41615 [Nonomuraea terrae]|uniref:Flagellar biosynthesis protein FlgA n=1 Tax=Nonomuraea terrae TaxID=2530383 RepID=A0A4R4XRF7_9ACTN|nr:hypothetical protein [Nonomuraea terrae]TDD33846.1 hypothetical protein E1286_41615 [Nonomuraea terrae]